MEPLLNAIWGTGLRKTVTSICTIHLAQAATTKAVYQLTMIQLQNQLYQAMKDKVSAPSPTVDQQIEVLQDQIRDLQTKINQGQ